jgi:hypothetical protein
MTTIKLYEIDNITKNMDIYLIFWSELQCELLARATCAVLTVNKQQVFLYRTETLRGRTASAARRQHFVSRVYGHFS